LKSMLHAPRKEEKKVKPGSAPVKEPSENGLGPLNAGHGKPGMHTEKSASGCLDVWEFGVGPGKTA